MTQNPGQEQIETQYETFFEDIDLSQFRDQIDPNIRKLSRALNYVEEEMGCGDIKVKTYPFGVEIYLRDTSMELESFGIIYFNGISYRAELHWHDDKNLVSLEFSRGKHDVEILFHGYFELKEKRNIIKITLIPRSKVFVFD